MTPARQVVLVTGSDGFIGSNLVETLQRRDEVCLYTFDTANSRADLETCLESADIVYHLAGVNRPTDPSEFEVGNTGLTREIISILDRLGRHPTVVFSSSVQASLQNEYGLSKRKAEDILVAYATRTGAAVRIYRLPNAFGKWSRPNYNSVVSTYCHNIARNLPITISDPDKAIELAYIDDIIRTFLADVRQNLQQVGTQYLSVAPTYKVTLARLAEELRRFKEMRSSLIMPSLDDRFRRCLYATYVSYFDVNDFAYGLEPKTDSRGALAEILKSQHVGQIFVSRTKPGITRGNHYHNTKVEKFLVLDGEAVIRFRDIRSGEIQAYTVNGNDFKVVDIPTGYTHSIQNVGSSELIVLFWASEIFDPETPDTIPLPVLNG
jgi:UDP-2-acetamido-2,6-beta-L-arabino-hexul-4-ose reductase